MKNIFRKLGILLLLLLTLALTVAHTQSSKGKIRGKVIDADTGEPLIGANVFIPGTYVGAATDVSGEFIMIVPPGTYNLQASYVGYSTITVSNVKVTPDTTIIINIQINSGGEEKAENIIVEEVIVEKKNEMPPVVKKGVKKPLTSEKSSVIKHDNYETSGNDLSSIIEEELQKLSVGKMLFKIPAEMKVGITERIIVRIASSVTADLQSGLKGKGTPTQEQIKVGPLMKVQLAGETFDIKPLTHEEQVVSQKEFTEWNWDVMPKKSGKQLLTLVVTVRLKIPNYGEEKKAYPVFDRQIDVKVNPFYTVWAFIKSNWQFFVGPIFTGLMGYYLKGWLETKKKRSKRR